MSNSFKIIQGDALTVLKNMPSTSVDLIIADPPYNLGKDYGNSSDNRDFDNYIDFTKKWTEECKKEF